MSQVEIDPDLRRKERIAMAKEICLHRGENPSAIDRRGQEGWEKYEPLAGAVIREADCVNGKHRNDMARDRKNEYRDETTGQYSYFGGFYRMCVCGHTLGDHCAGGWDCFAGHEGFKHVAAEPCGCQKFRPSRRKCAETTPIGTP